MADAVTTPSQGFSRPALVAFLLLRHRPCPNRQAHRHDHAAATAGGTATLPSAADSYSYGEPQSSCRSSESPARVTEVVSQATFQACRPGRHVSVRGSPTGHPGQSAARPQRPAKAPSHMTCPVNVSPSGGYPDGRTRRRAKNPPSLRRSEVYPLVFPPVLLGSRRGPGTAARAASGVLSPVCASHEDPGDRPGQARHRPAKRVPDDRHHHHHAHETPHPYIRVAYPSSSCAGRMSVPPGPLVAPRSVAAMSYLAGELRWNRRGWPGCGLTA